jgi:hypothetical protein
MSDKADPGLDPIDAIRTGLPPGVELDEREEAILDLAARQAGNVAAAEADIRERGYLVERSHGQKVVTPSIAEARQSRLALGKLLGQLRPTRVDPRERRPRLRGCSTPISVPPPSVRPSRFAAPLAHR